MGKALFITFNNIHQANTGGNQGSLRNFNILSKSFDTDFYLVESNNLVKFISLFLLYFPPFSFINRNQIERLIETNCYDLIFFDTTLFGNLQKYLFKKYKIKSLAFFHNVEYDFISVRFGRKLLKYPYLFLAWYNEKLALEYSDLTMCLSKRDENRIFEIYKKSPHFIVPVTFEDVTMKLNENGNRNIEFAKNSYCLFVGSYARANYEGIKWFINDVAIFLEGVKIVVAGKGFEKKRNELKRQNVTVLGTVDDLSVYYENAACVISPLFEGSGMKIKVVEALMYGRTIFGTQESFEGFDISDNTTTIICKTANDFIEKLKTFFKDENALGYNIKSRNLYLTKYSSTIAEKIFDDAFKSIYNQKLISTNFKNKANNDHF